MTRLTVALLVGALLTGVAYPGLTRAWSWCVAAVARFLSLVIALALLLDVPVGRRQTLPPLVAVDVSASWLRARDAADFGAALRDAQRAADGDTLWVLGAALRAAGEVVTASDAQSAVGALADRAMGTGRRITLFTDGELDDPERVAMFPAGSVIDVRAAAPRSDLAVRGLEAPSTVVAGDSIAVVVRLLAGGAGSAAGTLRLTVDDVALWTTPVPELPAWGEHELGAVVLPPPQGPAQRILRAVVSAVGDAEPRNDTLSATLDVASLPLGVVVSTAPDQDLRHALAVLRGTVGIPVRAFLQVAPGQWRVEPGLTRIAEFAVREAVAAAPFVVLHGDTAVFGPPRSVARGALALLVPAPDDVADEWYVTETPRSPLGLGLAGVAWDSLPPLAVGRAPTGAWTAMLARDVRGAPPRAVLVGDDVPRRHITMVASGTWRWAVRGGAWADAHRTLWGAVFDQLAAGGTERRTVGLASSVIREGEPLRWRRGAARDSLVRVVLQRSDQPGADTLVLRFAEDRSEALSAPLPAGTYEARVPDGDLRLVVSPSAEWLPRRAPTLPVPAAAAAAPPGGRTVRDLWWLYVAVVLTLSTEWLARRQHGLR